MSEMFLDAVQQAGIAPELANAGLVLQCFSLPALEEFAAVQRARGFDIPLVWLVACESGLPGEDELQRLQSLATYTGVGCATPLRWSRLLLAELDLISAHLPSKVTSEVDPLNVRDKLQARQEYAVRHSWRLRVQHARGARVHCGDSQSW